MSWKEFLEQVAAGGGFNKGEDGEWSASSLTDTEKKVLIEILPTPNGGELTQEEVGEKLSISVTTVRSHLDRIYDKLEVDEKGRRIIKLRKKLQDQFKLWSLEELAATQAYSSQPILNNSWEDLVAKSEYTGRKIEIAFNKDGFRIVQKIMEIKRGEKFFFWIHPEKQGDLILLENDGNEVSCLYPSKLIHGKTLSNGCIRIPEDGKFIIEPTFGRIQFLSIIMKSSSRIDWLEDAKNDLHHVLKEEDLALILDNITFIEEMFYREILVI